MDPEPPPLPPDGKFYVSYRLPARMPDSAEEVTIEQAEQILLARLQTENAAEAMWELAQFYKMVGKLDRASEVFHDLLKRVDDLETRAQITLALGQTAESALDFELAVRFYREGVNMEPCDVELWYYLHNNLGYSLNQLGRYKEGEEYCRRALTISIQHSNAFKNLGLALEGQGRYPEAAKCFVAATQANAADGRSTQHLADLIAAHPELEFDFGEYLKACQAAVAGVRKLMDERRQKSE